MAEGTQNTAKAVTTSSSEVLPERGGDRTAFVITPVTAGMTVYVFKGPALAVSGQGIPLITNQTYVESNSEGFKCWQGPIQVVASASGNVAISETLRNS